MTTPYPKVICKACQQPFESQIKIDPAVYAMFPNLSVGSNTFTCPHCGKRATYSGHDFKYSKQQADALTNYGKQIDPRNILILAETEPRVSQSLVWVQPLTQRLIKTVRDSGHWNGVSPEQLEEIVAELFSGFGYHVELTKRTRDGGRDVIAIGHSSIKSDKYLVECKHWENKVGVQVVRELLGVGQVEPNSGLILVSTSGFTKDARVLSDRETVRWILKLRDAADLEHWIEEYARLKGWPDAP